MPLIELEPIRVPAKMAGVLTLGGMEVMLAGVMGWVVVSGGFDMDTGVD